MPTKLVVMFHFKNFSLYHENSALKIGTDAVLLAAATPVQQVTSVLDIGCGCGVIALCLAWKMKQQNGSQSIIGIDIDESSILEAQKNLDGFPKNAQQDIQFLRQSIQGFSNEYQGKFDLIVSNPPFFVDSLKPNSYKKSVSKHNDTLPFEELIQAVTRLLAPKGKFYLILPKNEHDVFHQLAQRQWTETFRLSIKPTPQKTVNRIISAYQKCPSCALHFSELVIRTENNTYTSEYQDLTKEFYLDF